MVHNKFSKFYLKTPDERLKIISKNLNNNNLIHFYRPNKNFDNKYVDELSENVFSYFPLPLSVIPNFIVNNHSYIVPIVTEEKGVVAGASIGAKLCSSTGGFKVKHDSPIMTGQIFLRPNKIISKKIIKEIIKNKKNYLNKLNNISKTILKDGKKIDDMGINKIKTKKGIRILVELDIFVNNSAGANTTMQVCEICSPFFEELLNSKALLKLQKNLALKRLVKSKAIWAKEELENNIYGISAKKLIENILELQEFAKVNIERACTHNKGIMNGIDGVAVATGNDWRILESGIHAFAIRKGKYSPLTNYKLDKNKNLVGEIELPLVIGIVGGSIDNNPFAQKSLNILGVKSALELADILASVGLAQNFAALRQMALSGMLAGDIKLEKTKYKH
ncbi:MAG: hypothetical protein PHQ98_04685 [Candidatus ainarchaeum sp.]|nr:hypothetical protein [Candidatus ainarchaeum sp.]